MTFFLLSSTWRKISTLYLLGVHRWCKGTTLPSNVGPQFFVRIWPVLIPLWLELGSLIYLWCVMMMMMMILIKSISSIAGTPVKVDKNTSMGLRGRIARICVELGFTKPLIAGSGLVMRGTGLSMRGYTHHVFPMECLVTSSRIAQLKSSLFLAMRVRWRKAKRNRLLWPTLGMYFAAWCPARWEWLWTLDGRIQ